MIINIEKGIVWYVSYSPIYWIWIEMIKKLKLSWNNLDEVHIKPMGFHLKGTQKKVLPVSNSKVQWWMKQGLDYSSAS